MVTNVIAPDKLGGLERYVRELSAGLVDAGHSVTVISKRTQPAQLPNEAGSDGVRIVRVAPPSKKNPLFALVYPLKISRAVNKEVRSALRDGAESGDEVIVHGHFPVPMLGAAFSRLPYVYTCHAPVYKEILDERQGSYALPGALQKLAVWGLKNLERLVIVRARAIITLSRFIRNEVGELDEAAAKRITLVPGGLDTARFGLRDSYSDPASSGPTLFAARRLVKRTGAEELVAAMPHILRELPDAKLFLAGDGTRRRNVENAIVEKHLQDSVSMLGRIPDDELVSWYQRCDIAVTPTQALEGFGLSTVEALSCGTPALVTPVGANAEVVETLSPMLVSRDMSPEAIASAVVDLWRDAEELDRIRAAARAHVQPSLSWPTIVSKHLELYESVLSRSGSSGGSKS